MKVDAMAVGTFRENPNYVEIVDLLIDLHMLMRDGKGEAQAADDIRDKMDMPWWKLNEAEQQRIDGMSADLYTLEPDSPIEHVADSNVYSQELSAEIDNARRIGDYGRILEMLRERSREISADRAAVLRGLCYEKLGDVDTAILFYEHGATLRQSDDSHAAFLLTKLEQLDKTDRSLNWVRKFLRRFDDLSPQLLLTSARVLLRSIECDESNIRAVLEETEQLVAKAIGKMKDSHVEPPLRVLAVNELVELAVRYGEVGARERMGALLDGALRVNPDDDLALTVRGLFNYATNAEVAIKDFERAIKNQTSIIWPYFYSAHYWITNKEFQRSRQFCDLALSLATAHEAVAALWMWKAICSFELSEPTATTRRYFDNALQFSPWNETIRFNTALFESITTHDDHLGETWSIKSEVEPVDATRFALEQRGLSISPTVAA